MIEIGYPIGKLSPKVMENLLKKFQPTGKNSEVLIPPQPGQDSGILRHGDSFMVVKANPVTFATDEIGYYAVILNANDIVTAGAIPKWFTATVLLPERITTSELCESIFTDLSHECQKIGVDVIAGHTEVTAGLTRPIIAGSMIGILPPGKKPISTLDGRPEDVLLLVKEIAIEGTAIIAKERPLYLQDHGVNIDLIRQAQSYLHNPGISIVNEAQLLSHNFEIHAMHGPTEGGIAMGLVELAKNSKCGMILEQSQLIVSPITEKFCEIFQLDPWGLISSGCLIVAIDPQDEEKIHQFLHKHKVPAKTIGHLTNNQNQYMVKNSQGQLKELTYSHIDEITKIF